MNTDATRKCRWPPVALWTIGIALAFAIVPLLMWSGHLYYAEGGQSPDAPGMLVAAVIMTSPVWLSCWVGFMTLFLVRYRGGARLWPLAGGTLWSAILGIVATSATLIFLLAIIRVDFWRITRAPFTLHLLACAGYCQMLRGAAVARSLPQREREQLARTFA